MAGYVIVGVDWQDDDGRREYVRLLRPTLEQYGGRFIVGADRPDFREGDWRPGIIVILEFDSLARATRWYESEEYADAHAIRMRSAKSDVVLVDGIRPGADRQGR